MNFSIFHDRFKLLRRGAHQPRYLRYDTLFSIMNYRRSTCDCLCIDLGLVAVLSARNRAQQRPAEATIFCQSGELKE